MTDEQPLRVVVADDNALLREGIASLLEAAEEVLDRWELHRAVIGEVTVTRELRAFWDGEPVGEIPARFLIGQRNAPVAHAFPSATTWSMSTSVPSPYAK